MSLVFNKQTHISWAFTIKILHKPAVVDETTYEKVLAKFMRMGEVKYWVFEHDSCGVGHVHGVIELPCGTLRRKLITSNFNINLVALHDEEGWKRYLNKEKFNVVEYCMRNEYLFDVANILPQFETGI